MKKNGSNFALMIFSLLTEHTLLQYNIDLNVHRECNAHPHRIVSTCIPAHVFHIFPLPFSHVRSATANTHAIIASADASNSWYSIKGYASPLWKLTNISDDAIQNDDDDFSSLEQQRCYELSHYAPFSPNPLSQLPA